MNTIIAAVSIIAQVAGFLAIGWMFYDLFTFPEALFESASGDTELIQQYIAETVLSYRPGLGVGALGAIASWLLILKGRFHSAWFMKTARVLAWVWMPLVPIGTVLGVLVLSARASALEESTDARAES